MLSCRNCGSTDLELVLDLGKQPWGNHFVPKAQGENLPRYPLEFHICKHCWMAQIGYTIPKEAMFINHNYVSGTTRSLADHFSRIAEEIASRVHFGPADYAVDIGGNDGTFLVQLKRHGAAVLNVESGRLQAERSEAVGVPCLNVFFNHESALDIARQRGKAIAIHGSGVLFHLEELHSAFEGISALLADNGRLIAEFIYLPQMVENCAFDQIYHEHLVYYTLHSFGRLLKRHGLKLVDARLDPIHGGSCVAWIAHETDPEQPSLALLELLAYESKLGVDGMEFYREFARKVEALRARLIESIKHLKSQGLSIQALGAPVKGTTIINYCAFDADAIDCAVEINELKVGCYIPGTHIPVLHQDETPPPDVYLMLAWNFKEEIIRKLESFQRNGGKFLIPIPEPHMV